MPPHHHDHSHTDRPFAPLTAVVMGAGHRLLVAIAASATLWLTVRWALS